MLLLRFLVLSSRSPSGRISLCGLCENPVCNHERERERERDKEGGGFARKHGIDVTQLTDMEHVVGQVRGFRCSCQLVGACVCRDEGICPGISSMRTLLHLLGMFLAILCTARGVYLQMV